MNIYRIFFLFPKGFLTLHRRSVKVSRDETFSFKRETSSFIP